MALDLSALEEKTVAAGPAVAAPSTGKPLDIPLEHVEEDPDQPRKEFTAEAMQEMTDSIRARGVKTPVSVRSHPSKPGKWMLNYGARRYRGSAAAGRATIPAFVDEAHDDYDQVIENIQRDDLKPMELALFIKKRLDAGDQKKAIAKNLGKDGALITQHLALIDPPACVEDAYSTGKCTSPKTLYELRGLYEKYPEQVERWCADSVEITRKTVADLADELKGKKKPAPKPEDAGKNDGSNTGEAEAGKFGHDQIPDDKTGQRDDSSSPGPTESGETVATLPFHNPDIEKDDKGPTISDPNKIKKPLLLVELEGRAAMVLLNRRPTTSGLLWIRYEDGSGEVEVAGSDCLINLLTEAEK